MACRTPRNTDSPYSHRGMTCSLGTASPSVAASTSGFAARGWMELTKWKRCAGVSVSWASCLSMLPASLSLLMPTTNRSGECGNTCRSRPASRSIAISLCAASITTVVARLLPFAACTPRRATSNRLGGDDSRARRTAVASSEPSGGSKPAAASAARATAAFSASKSWWEASAGTTVHSQPRSAATGAMVCT